MKFEKEKPGSQVDDLLHFLNVAAMQIRARLERIERSEVYSSRINQLRMLEELIREQMPTVGKKRK